MPIFNTTISGGGQQPSGTITITSNTTTNVAQYEYAVTAVPTTAPAHYIEKTVDANGVLQSNPNIINMTGVTDIGNFALAFAYYGVTFPSNTGLGFSVTTISGYNACQSMFQACTGLTSFSLSALTTIIGDSACASMFASCNGLTSFDLSALTTIGGFGACDNMFNSCTGLTSMDLSALNTISDYSCVGMFYGCTSLTTVYIGGTTAITFGSEPFGNMFEGCPQNIDVYAPAANQAEIEAMDGYPNFGGTGTVTWHWRS